MTCPETLPCYKIKVFLLLSSLFRIRTGRSANGFKSGNGTGAHPDKVVALPVKDPYHIIRNYILIIELLYKLLSPSTFLQT